MYSFGYLVNVTIKISARTVLHRYSWNLSMYIVYLILKSFVFLIVLCRLEIGTCHICTYLYCWINKIQTLFSIQIFSYLDCLLQSEAQSCTNSFESVDTVYSILGVHIMDEILKLKCIKLEANWCISASALTISCNFSFSFKFWQIT